MLVQKNAQLCPLAHIFMAIRPLGSLVSTCFHSKVWAWLSQGQAAIQIREIGWICTRLQHPQKLGLTGLTALLKRSSSAPQGIKKSSPSRTHPPALISECRDNYLTLVSAYSNIACPARSPGRAHNRPADDAWVWISSYGTRDLESLQSNCRASLVSI